MSENNIFLFKTLLEDITAKAKSTSSKTEKIKYICALLALEECIFKHNATLSNECRSKYNEIINNWNV